MILATHQDQKEHRAVDRDGIVRRTTLALTEVPGGERFDA